MERMERVGADGAGKSDMWGYIFRDGADVGFSTGYIFIDNKKHITPG